MLRRCQYVGTDKPRCLQDVSWFDLKEVAALPAEINDDLEPPGYEIRSMRVVVLRGTYCDRSL